MDVARCLFFTWDSDAYSKNPCVFTWFWKVMPLSMVFGWFSLSFPMAFHGGAFREIPYGSQGPPEAPQVALSLRGTKVEGPKRPKFAW